MACLALGSWLAVVNIVAFALAAADKAQAVRGGGAGRVPEAVLLASSLLGGWVGLGTAMVVFRHKVRKARFLVPFLATVVAGLALLFVLASRLACVPPSLS